MTTSGKSFNEVKTFVKKVEGVRETRQDKVLTKRPKGLGNF